MAKVRANIRFSAIFLDGTRVSKIVRTPAGKYLSANGVEQVLAAESALLEKHFPDREFRLVPLADGNFNFIEMSKEEAELREKRSELRKEYSEPAAV